MRRWNKGLAYLLTVCLCSASVSFPVFAQEPEAVTVQSVEPVEAVEPMPVQPVEPAEPVQPQDSQIRDSQDGSGTDTASAAQDMHKSDGLQGNKTADQSSQSNDTESEEKIKNDIERRMAEAGSADPGKERLQGNVPEEFYGPATFGLRAAGIQHNSKFNTGYTIQDGIDVSEHNGIINWTKVKQAGIDFAFIRVAYRGWGTAGNLVTDARAFTNLKEAIAAGIPVGVYIFSQATSEAEAKEEANYIIDKIQGYNVTLPVIMDFEFASENGLVGRLYDKLKKTSKSAATKICTAFCKQAASRGYTPMVYGNPDMLNNYLNPGTISASYPIWLAHYTTKTDYTGDYTYWQYSSTGNVNGISGYVDMNVGYIKNGVTQPDIPPVDSLDTPVLSSAANSNGGVTVKWKALTNAKGYYVYRKTAADTEWKKIATMFSNDAVQYLDSTVVSGTEYIYTVSGYNGDVISGYNEEGVRVQYLKAPVLKSAEGSSTAVKITWEKVPEADGYYVHRKLSGGKWEQIAVIKSNSTVTYSDKAGTEGETYYYTVSAFKGDVTSGYNSTGLSEKKATYEKYKTTTGVNYRSGAGTSYTIKGTLAKGKTIDVEKNYSKKADGYTWYRFKLNSNTYYIASEYIQKVTTAASQTPAAAAITKPTTTAAATKPAPTYIKYKTKAKVNYRSGAGTSYAVKGSLAKGKTINVEKGYSKKKNGYTWYRFKKGTKTYYVVSKYLKKAEPTYIKYKTKAKVNYRSGAGTSYKVKGTLAKGKKINVEKGYSKKKNGYTWYRFKKGTKTYYIASKYLKKV